jgi:type III secretion protein S
MTPAIELLRQALWLTLLLSAPLIAVVAVVGLLIAIVQAVTQIQEQTVQFLFKLIALGLALLFTARLLGASLYEFANRLFTGFPGFVQ